MKAFVAGLVAVLVATAVVLVSPAEAAPVYFSQTPIAGDQVNGTGYATAVVGDVAYVGGSFTTVRTQTGQTVASRANLAAFDLRTGRLITSFRADTNGAVRTLVSDGSALYVGGSFTTVNGTTRRRLARVDLVTGAVDTSFTADANSNVYSVAIGGGRLVMGGSFSSVNNVARQRAAVVNLTNGSLQGFNPTVNASINAVEILPDGSKVFLGGNFTSVNGQARSRLIALDAASGATATPTFSPVDGHAIALDLSDDGRYLGAALAGAGNQGAYFDVSSGARRWRQRCDGDAQAVAIISDSMFTGFHESCDGNTTRRIAANDARTNGARDLDFMPTFDRYWGAWGLDGNAGGLVVAGDFTNVSGVPAQGFAIFPPRGTTATETPVGGITLGSSWAYRDTGTDLGTAWRAEGYDDAAWARGNAQLGYGDGDESTVVSFGPSATQKYVTTYFRRTVDLAAAPTRVDLGVLADDGAVVYVNGVEAARDNMPTGTIGFGTLSSTGRSGADESAVRFLAVDPGLFRAGTNTIAVEVHQDNRSSSDLSFDLVLEAYVPAGTTTTTTSTTSTSTTSTTTTSTTTTSTTTTTTTPPPTGGFALGSSWAYLATATAPGADWNQPAFDAGSWPSGNAQLGYGDGDEATTVPFGPSASAKWPTTYFRRTVNLSAAPSSATISLVADDGAVVYVNGVEVVRDNMPAGAIGYTTLAASGRWNAAENAVRTFAVPASLLQAGTNVIAVEVHQDAANSSDLSFDAALTVG